jgi:hypothetical protein
MSYPTVLKTGALKDIFSKIKSSGTPTAFTAKHLKSLGFTSSNDVPILSALKFIGFIDSSSKPTEKYTNYKGKDGGKILAKGIKNGYSELFALYPDAEKKDEESLMHFFATKTEVSESSRKVMIGTFKALCSLANFEPLGTDDEQENTLPENQTSTKDTGFKSKTKLEPSVNINIELQMPATNDPEVYKNFFEAMKKYLLND